MNYNYHTHTKRCRHASGEPEEYIKIAIENGIEYMGFSDHIPLRFDDGTESSFRVPTNEGKIYCDEIKTLAEKYKDKIDIKVGFEVEYYPEYFDFMLSKAIEYGAEYMILGQHYLKPDNLSVPHTIIKTDAEDELKKYVEIVSVAMEKKIFSYVAHPDIFNFSGDSLIYCRHMHNLCNASKRFNTPIEINFLGIREKRNYPDERFWQIAGEEQSPVTFGFDAHDALSAFDEKSLKYAMMLVDKYNLNYIGKPNLVLIK